MDRPGVERWIEAYRRAWATDAPDDIAALFSEDVTYSPYPWPRDREPWRGRETVVRNWIGRGESGAGWRFEHRILAVEGDTAVVEGWTYYEARDDEPETAFANVWLLRFADDGTRVREFTEWWVERPRLEE